MKLSQLIRSVKAYPSTRLMVTLAPNSVSATTFPRFIGRMCGWEMLINPIVGAVNLGLIHGLLLAVDLTDDQKVPIQTGRKFRKCYMICQGG